MYDKMFHFIKEYLENNSGEGSKNGHYPFRTRSDHIQRVFMWSERLVTNESSIETGALSVIWDCMAEGAEQQQTFEKTYNHIMNYSYASLNINPMVTVKAKEFWQSKQKLIHLSYDLGIESI